MTHDEIQIDLYRVVLPLSKSYDLSLGSFQSFDGVICRARDANGNLGWGEAIALPGYSEENEANLWENVNRVAQKISDGDSVPILPESFAPSAVLTALEHMMLFPDVELREIPQLVGIVSVRNVKKILPRVRDLLKAGYQTIKIKVGMAGVETDVRQINMISDEIPSGVKLRIDANQHYTVKDVNRFADGANLEKIEFLEQPFSKERWDLLDAVHPLPIPLVLDESIWTERDLAMAKKKGIAIVKLKLFKHGGLLQCSKMIQKAFDLGFEVILGNGFQGEIGCWHEMCLAEKNGISSVLESNGYLKLRNSLLKKDFSLKGKLDVSQTKLKQTATMRETYTIKKILFVKNLLFSTRDCHATRA